MSTARTRARVRRSAGPPDDTAAAGASTRQRLLAAAQAIVEESGYGGASVAAIAGRAGVSTGALYRHWPSKSELFAGLFRSVCDRELAAMEAAGAAVADSPAADRVEAVLAAFARRALRKRRLAWALIAEPVDPLVDAERLAYRHAYARLLAAALAEGVDRGELPDQDPRLTAAALVGGVGEALVGPVSPLAMDAPDADRIVAALRAFTRRAVGATAAPPDRSGTPLASRGPRP